MEVENMLAQSLTLTQEQMQLDAACKRLIANKVILAWIMKHTMKEYAEYDVTEIAERFIEGVPQIADIAVHQDEVTTELIAGMGSESSSVQEGTVTYDIRFFAIHPVSNEWVRLIINVEAQSDFYPGYPLVKRGIYYGSRMISSQHGTEFTGMHYEKITKVYSVWLCLNPPKCRQNTITEYSICERNHFGHVQEKRENYDLMTVIMICLGCFEDSAPKLLKMLDVLFSDESAEVKKRRLTEEFDIKMTRKLEREVAQMCDYSKGVMSRGFERGIEKGIERGIERGIETSIRNLMNSMKWTVSQAMEALQVPENQREQYRIKIEQK